MKQRRFRADYKLIRKAIGAQTELSADESGRLRQDFFVSMAHRAIAHALKVRRDEKSLLDEIVPLILDRIRGEPNLFVGALSDQLLSDPTGLGWAYQVWNSADRDANSWAISKKDENRHENVDIATVTQVFTDRYIADFLISRCFSLWREGSAGGQSCPSICDPAVGTGHLLVAAISGCVARGVAVDDIAFRVFGYDIDPLSVVLSRAAIFCELIRCGFSGNVVNLARHLQGAVRALDQTYGTLDRTAVLNSDRVSFDIVLANPPYLGRRKLPAAFRDFLDLEYPAASMDLCAAFLQRCIELLSKDGSLGVITSDKWLRLKGYTSLRLGDGNFKGLYGELAVDGIYELGERAFSPDAALHDGMRAAILIARKAQARPDHRLAYARLAPVKQHDEKKRELSVCETSPQESRYVTAVNQTELAAGRDVFLKLSGLPESFLRNECKVGDLCNVVVGCQTNNDALFVRYIWQLPKDRTGWRVHCKGGGYARWAGLGRWAINWSAGADSFFSSSKARDRAEQWIAEDGWVYSWFANGNLGVRRKPSDWSFGRAAAGGIFVNDRRIVAFLNSRIASASVRSLGGKIQLPEGVVKSIPAPSDLEPIDERLIDLVVQFRERVAATELTDALFRPGDMPQLEQILELEALILVIEGHLERQVELSLNLNQSEREDLVDCFGMLAGWHLPSKSISDYELTKLLPDEYRVFTESGPASQGARIRKSPAFAPSEAEELILARIKYFQGEKRHIFPCSGIVELLCRELLIHPYDALNCICELLRSSPAVAHELYGNHLAKYLVEQVLNHLGFMWWITPAAAPKQGVAAVSFDDVVSLAKDLISNSGFTNLSDLPVEDWVGDVFDKWQERYFFGASPFLVNGDKRLFKTVELR